MKTIKFITPVIMKVSITQFERDLKKPLTDLCYRSRAVRINMMEETSLVTNYASTNDIAALLNYPSVDLPREEIIEYNPKLFLALAAMTNEKYGIKGEWWKFIGSSEINGFTSGKLYQALKPINTHFAFINDKNITSGYSDLPLSHFKKATVDEIRIHFHTLQCKKENMNKKETSRFPVVISFEAVKKLYASACPKWKPTIRAAFSENVFSGKTNIVSIDFYNKMREAATTKQHKLLDEIFGKEEKRKVILTTTDGKDKYVGDTFYTVDSGIIYTQEIFENTKYDASVKKFNSRTLAEIYQSYLNLLVQERQINNTIEF